jgi:hypothetical protein
MTTLNPEFLLKSAEELDQMDDERQYMMLLAARAAYARELPFGAEGFGHFYWCGTHHELPPYARDYWVPPLVDAKLHGTGVILEGFRGATKSTVIFWWVLYVLGKRPVGSTVLCRINDAAAAETGNAMAEIIEKSVAWKLVFPNVVPDQSRRWSTEGWFIKDTDVHYPTWVQQTVSDHLGEPSILTAGITSGVHIGKHPSNGWYFDDFHDEQNTRSLREMRNIVDTIEKNIIPTWTRPEGHPTLAGACTFWDDNDGYHSLLKTGLFKHVRTPIFTLDPKSDIVYQGLSHHGEHVRLAWPEAFPVERIMAIENQNPVWFPVMYLCDLGALRGTVLKKEWLNEYPVDMIDESWPVYMGVDFASSNDRLNDKERDFFAVAIGRAIPGGGLVIVDGYRGKIPASESMGKLKTLYMKYSPRVVTIGIEKWGKGETFKDLLVYSTELPISAVPWEGMAVKSKGQRYETEGGLAPMFVDGRLWIAESMLGDFREAFTNEWISWDGQQTKTGHDDCLDAVYWLAYVGQGHLAPTADRNRVKRREKKKDFLADMIHRY